MGICVLDETDGESLALFSWEKVELFSELSRSDVKTPSGYGSPMDGGLIWHRILGSSIRLWSRTEPKARRAHPLILITSPYNREIIIPATLFSINGERPINVPPAWTDQQMCLFIILI